MRCADQRGRPCWKRMNIMTHCTRETETERGGASHGCRCAERENKKLHLGSCCQGNRLSSAAADTQRQGQDAPPVGHQETLEPLRMLSWRLNVPLLAGWVSSRPGERVDHRLCLRSPAADADTSVRVTFTPTLVKSSNNQRHE